MSADLPAQYSWAASTALCVHMHTCVYIKLIAWMPLSCLLCLCSWEISYAYYARIETPSSPLTLRHTTAKLLPSALWWSISPASCIQKKDACVCALHKNCKCGDVEWCFSLNYCASTSKEETENYHQKKRPWSNILGSQISKWKMLDVDKSWAEPSKKQSAGQHNASSSCDACGPGQTHFLFQILLAECRMCPNPRGHIIRVHLYIKILMFNCESNPVA